MMVEVRQRIEIIIIVMTHITTKIRAIVPSIKMIDTETLAE